MEEIIHKWENVFDIRDKKDRINRMMIYVGKRNGRRQNDLRRFENEMIMLKIEKISMILKKTVTNADAMAIIVVLQKTFLKPNTIP